MITGRKNFRIMKLLQANRAAKIVDICTKVILRDRHFDLVGFKPVDAKLTVSFK